MTERPLKALEIEALTHIYYAPAQALPQPRAKRAGLRRAASWASVTAMLVMAGTLLWRLLRT
jgi:hypothetical protein